MFVDKLEMDMWSTDAWLPPLDMNFVPQPPNCTIPSSFPFFSSIGSSIPPVHPRRTMHCSGAAADMPLPWSGCPTETFRCGPQVSMGNTTTGWASKG